MKREQFIVNDVIDVIDEALQSTQEESISPAAEPKEANCVGQDRGHQGGEWHQQS
jgi:hypothetical protein